MTSIYKLPDDVKRKRNAWAAAHRFLANRNMTQRHPRKAMELRCALHLIDLKIAGHSPTRTEFIVPGGR